MRARWRTRINIAVFIAIIGASSLVLYNGSLSQNSARKVVVERSPAWHRHPAESLSWGHSTKPPVNTGAKVKLIILTYMRSGSSFTGDLFNQHPAVFYVYEPLWSIEKHFGKGETVFFLNKTSVVTDQKQFFQPMSMTSRILQAFLECSFEFLDPATLGQYHLKNSRTTKPFYDCQKKRQGILGAVHCLPLMFSACQKASVTSVKTIRFAMAQAAHLIRIDPKVKVIHLLRDPRGTLYSQNRVGEFKLDDVDMASKAFCQRVLDDLKQAKKIKTQTPGRLMTVRYEDLAREPLTFAQKLLRFAGLRMDHKLSTYLWNITSAGQVDDCVICTTRNDSRKTATKWRTKLDWNSSNVIDQNCKEIYKRVGYFPLSTKEKLLNISVPSLRGPGKVSGLWA